VEYERDEGEPRRQPWPLEGEERAREEEVDAGEGQGEREPEERLRHLGGRLRVELPALVDEPYDRRGERHRDGRARHEQERDLPHSGPRRRAQPGEVALGGEAAEDREQ